MLRAAEGFLVDRGVDAPRLSVEWMLARVLGVGRLDVYLAHDRPLEEEEKQRLREMVARRGRGEPLAYVLGDAEFCDLTFRVTSAVLIPRPETEVLVTLLRDELPQGARGIDLGTGSGAIAVSLCHHRPDVTMIATDRSEAALAVARENAATAGVDDRIEFRLGSWWEPVGETSPMDFAVSNPPYVDPDQPEILAADVAAFEPETALFTPAGDPGAPYRAIVAGVGDHLRSGARLALETGVGADVASLAALEGSEVLRDVELRNDEAGLPRYLLARRR